MNEFINIEILGTIAGCSAVITLLTQVFKKYLVLLIYLCY